MDDMEDRVTAGELRAIGYPIPEAIPDCGNIPRSAIEIYADPNVKPTLGDGQTLILPTIVKINAPFQWVEATITATKADPS